MQRMAEKPLPIDENPDGGPLKRAFDRNVDRIVNAADSIRAETAAGIAIKR